MNLFERRLGKPDRSDLPGWMDAVERHMEYLQERMEYGYRQVEARLNKLEGSGKHDEV